MPPLPVISGRHAVKVFEAAGWRIARQRGSHIIMTKLDGFVTLAVPDHNELARGTLRKLIRLADMTVDHFTNLM
ncbi:MAG: type II toxin-antitoxin system HicA family toxin [Kiritimatiellia bacterium]